MFSDLKVSVLEIFADAQLLANVEDRVGSGPEGVRWDKRGSAVWQAILADEDAHRLRKEQNRAAAKRYLDKPGNREKHNAKMRAYHRQRKEQRLRERCE